MKVIEKAPAKINLSLDVLGKRPDGYHEVKMVMTTVDLSDRIECQEIEGGGITIRSSAPFVPEDERNLAYQAAALIKERFGIQMGVAIHISKEIPVAAGLAGGSSDAAATIRALNRLWRLNLSQEDMMEMAAVIGSDVGFCIRGGTALATGRGEYIQPLPAPPPCWVILGKPSVSISTADTYAALDLKGAKHPDVDGMTQALEAYDYEGLCARLGNVLEAVTMKDQPDVRQIKSAIERMGADGVLMSGSGPTVFGLVRHETRLHRIYNSLKGFCPQVFGIRLLGAPCDLQMESSTRTNWS